MNIPGLNLTSNSTLSNSSNLSNSTNSTNSSNSSLNDGQSQTISGPSFPYDELYYENPNSDNAITTMQYLILMVGIPWAVAILLALANIIICICVKKRSGTSTGKLLSSAEKIPFQNIPNIESPQPLIISSPMVSNNQPLTSNRDNSSQKATTNNANKSLLYGDKRDKNESGIHTLSKSVVVDNMIALPNQLPNSLPMNIQPKRPDNGIFINNNPGIPLPSNNPVLRAIKNESPTIQKKTEPMFPHENDPNYGDPFSLKKKIKEDPLGVNLGNPDALKNQTNVINQNVSPTSPYPAYPKHEYPIRLPPINQKKGIFNNNLLLDPFSNK